MRNTGLVLFLKFYWLYLELNSNAKHREKENQENLFHVCRTNLNAEDMIDHCSYTNNL